MTPRERLQRLIEQKCVLHGDFVLASGQKSKIYFDCKRATLDPEGLHLIATLILDHLDDLARRDGRPVEAIGGPTIGADPVVGHVAGRS
ncbi:MAG TPA: orotate phosphoribosyltransferase, partial [Candidatus Polarisedimenticolia bacterium]|nr:orotate phosphoribosyltransferase [Candidatus Polarisedimenticolia bacterium]